MRRLLALAALLPGLAFAAPINPPSPVTADAAGDALVARQFIAGAGLSTSGFAAPPSNSVLVTSNCWYNDSSMCFSNNAGGNGTGGWLFLLGGSFTAGGVVSITRQGIFAGSGATVSGAGTTQATATPISAQNNLVSSCASGAGVRLVVPSSLDAGVPVMWVNNMAANACLVYPQSGGSIFQSGTVTANASYSCAAYTDCHFTYLSSTEWVP